MSSPGNTSMMAASIDDIHNSTSVVLMVGSDPSIQGGGRDGGGGGDVSVDYVDMDKATVDAVNKITICYIQPLISLFGLVGNVLSLIILIRLRKKHHSNIMLIGLAICDTLYLLAKNYDLVICIKKGHDTLTARNWAIIITPYMTFIPVILSRVTGLITSLLAVDRFIALTWPFWFKTAVTTTKVVVLMVLCYIVPFATHFPQFMRNTVVYRYSPRLGYDLPYVTVTKLYTDNKEFFDIYKNLVLSIVFYIIPLTVIIITSIINIYKLRQLSGSNIRKETASNNTARERKATITLIWISVIYVICNVPSFCFLITRYIMPEFDYHGKLKQMSILVSKNTSVFIAVNSSVNFAVYCFAGESFRTAFLEMFGCRQNGQNKTKSSSLAGSGATSGGGGGGGGKSKHTKQTLNDSTTTNNGNGSHCTDTATLTKD